MRDLPVCTDAYLLSRAGHAGQRLVQMFHFYFSLTPILDRLLLYRILPIRFLFH